MSQFWGAKITKKECGVTYSWKKVLLFITNIPTFRRINEEMRGESVNPSTNWKKKKSIFTSYFILAVKLK